MHLMSLGHHLLPVLSAVASANSAAAPMARMERILVDGGVMSGCESVADGQCNKGQNARLNERFRFGRIVCENVCGG